MALFVMLYSSFNFWHVDGILKCNYSNKMSNLFSYGTAVLFLDVSQIKNWYSSLSLALNVFKVFQAKLLLERETTQRSDYDVRILYGAS